MMKINTGIYRIGETETQRENPVEVLVARGRSINTSDAYGFNNIRHMQVERWYIVYVVTHIAHDRGTNEEYTIRVPEIRNGYETKKEAQDRAKQLISTIGKERL